MVRPLCFTFSISYKRILVQRSTNRSTDLTSVRPQSVDPIPEAYFVILGFDSRRQINQHQRARCRTYPVLVLSKIRLKTIFKLILIYRPIKSSNSVSQSESKIHQFENQPEYSLDSFSSYEIPVTFESLLDSEKYVSQSD